MSDYLQSVKEKPTVLYRKTGALEFVDNHGKVYATGDNPPDGYYWAGVVQPLNAPQMEVFALGGEKE